MDVGWLPVVWVGLGATVLVASLLAVRSRRAYRVAVAAVSLLWVVAGGGANAWFLARGEDFSGFAGDSWSSFVRDTWESLVVPRAGIFIGLLIAFEVLAGVLVLVEGRVRWVALCLLVAFNVALVSFGWGYLVWSVPMVVALGLLWRASRVRDRAAYRDAGEHATEALA